MQEIQTKYFGAILYDPEDALTFETGLFGFEEERRFLLLPFGGDDSALLCLQSLDTPGLAFVVMNPFALLPEYAPVLQEGELRALNAEQSEELCYYVLCVVREPVGNSTVNLKCPVAINADIRRAAQVILETGEYGMRHPLSDFKQGEAEATC